MCRIGGRLRSYSVSYNGVVGEIPLLQDLDSNHFLSTRNGTVSGRQFDWGGRLLKSNGGVQRFPQAVWKSAIRVQRHKGA